MKIAVLYLATGKYFIFWENFYKSAKENLFKGADYQLHFFLFTDREIQESEDVSVIAMENEPWPLPTLKRYHYFLSQEEHLKKFDYIYFFNANTVFINPVAEAILPKAHEQFAFVQQPYTLTQTNDQFGYERRKESMASIDYGNGEIYIWGAFNGGRSEAFLKMAHQIREWTTVDLQNGIIAAFWDESFLNKYLLTLDRRDYTLVDNELFLVDGFNDGEAGNSVVSIHILEKSKFFDVSFKNNLPFTSRVKAKLKQLLGF